MILLTTEVRPPDWPLSLTGLSPPYNLQTSLVLASSSSIGKTTAGIEPCNHGYLCYTQSFQVCLLWWSSLYLGGGWQPNDWAQTFLSSLSVCPRPECRQHSTREETTSPHSVQGPALGQRTLQPHVNTRLVLLSSFYTNLWMKVFLFGSRFLQIRLTIKDKLSI